MGGGTDGGQRELRGDFVGAPTRSTTLAATWASWAAGRLQCGPLAAEPLARCWPITARRRRQGARPQRGLHTVLTSIPRGFAGVETTPSTPSCPRLIRTWWTPSFPSRRITAAPVWRAWRILTQKPCWRRGDHALYLTRCGRGTCLRLRARLPYASACIWAPNLRAPRDSKGARRGTRYSVLCPGAPRTEYTSDRLREPRPGLACLPHRSVQVVGHLANSGRLRSALCHRVAIGSSHSGAILFSASAVSPSGLALHPRPPHPCALRRDSSRSSRHRAGLRVSLLIATTLSNTPWSLS